MITSQVSRVQYTGNAATTIFPYPFLILDQAHLRVIVTTSGVDVVKTLTTDYIVSGVGVETGGAVAFVSPPAAGAIVTIRRVVPYTQETDYIANDNFPAETHEETVDKLTMEVQQLVDQMSRSMQLPETEVSSTNPILPAKATRVGTLLGFDSNGDPYLFHIDPNTLIISPAVTINTINIADRAVTEPKLAFVLDLSAHTLTYPAGQMGGAGLASVLDLSSKSVAMGNQTLYSNNQFPLSIGKDALNANIQFSTVGVNLSSAGIIVEGAGTAAANGTYYATGGIVNNFQKYVSASGYYIQSDVVGTKWSIYSAAAAELYNCVIEIAGAYFAPNTTTPDQEPNPYWEIVGGAGPIPTLRFDTGYTPLTESADKVVVNGTVRATAFKGDGSQLTGINAATIAFSAFPMPGDSGVNTGRASMVGGYGGLSFVTGDSGVMFGGYCGVPGGAAANYFTPDATGYTGSIRRMVIRATGSFQAVTTVRTSSTVVRAVGPYNTSTLNYGDFLSFAGLSITKIVHTKANIFVLAGGILFGIGRNTAGQLGQGDTTDRPYFTAIKIGATAGESLFVSDFSVTPTGNAGYATPDDVTVIARTATNKVYTWGSNGNGQCGLAAATAQSTPFNNAAWAFNADTISQVLTCGLNTWVLTSTGKVYGTGLNSSGALGITTDTTQKTNFTQATNTGTTVIVSRMYAAGSFVTATDGVCFYALAAAGALYACGYGADKALGQGASTTSLSLLTLVDASITPISKLWPMGGQNVWCCALKTNGGIVTWGYNGAGQLGDVTGSTTNSGVAISPSSLASAVSGTSLIDVVGVGTAAGYGTTFALFGNGLVYSSGKNANGEQGLGHSTEDTTTRKFQKIPFPSTISSIHGTVGYNIVTGTIYAADTAGRVWGSGQNAHYQLGLGHALPVFTPNQVRI